MRVIFAGTGRSATGYCRAAVEAMGVTCGHEHAFTPAGPRPSKLLAESSWMAVPYLNEYPEAFKVLVYRPPLDVIASFMKRRFFDTPSAWRDYIDAHNPSMLGLTGLEAAFEHYATWNMMALRHADYVSSPDRIPWGEIAARLGVKSEASSEWATVPTDVNTDAGPKPELELSEEALADYAEGADWTVFDTYAALERRRLEDEWRISTAWFPKQDPGVG
ncbi:MAG: hypothetical protein RLZZ01_273 [Actinomycetota bacterium]